MKRAGQSWSDSFEDGCREWGRGYRIYSIRNLSFCPMIGPLPTNHLNLLLNPHNPENINTEVEKREEGEK